MVEIHLARPDRCPGQDSLPHEGEDDALEVEGQAAPADETAQQLGQTQLLPQPLEDQDGPPDRTLHSHRGSPADSTR
jgi:hypothetical protein